MSSPQTGLRPAWAGGEGPLALPSRAAACPWAHCCMRLVLCPTPGPPRATRLLWEMDLRQVALGFGLGN